MLVGENETLVWKMRSHSDRFTGRFSSDHKTITGHWEMKTDERDWIPWVDVTFEKRENASG